MNKETRVTLLEQRIEGLEKNIAALHEYLDAFKAHSESLVRQINAQGDTIQSVVDLVVKH